MSDAVNKPRSNYLNPARVIILGSLAIILVGALLLSLPVASRGATGMPFLTALFTSTSAICVTGLAAVDTALDWSLFGQIVIIILIQIGGLGFMSITTIALLLMHKKIGLSQRLLIMQSMDLRSMQGVVRMIIHVMVRTLAIEGVGAAVLAWRFYPVYGLPGGIWMGIFHSISAFCNAGFDLIGGRPPFSSLSVYAGDHILCATFILLVFIGGLGFYVWEDIWQTRSFKKLHLHSKLVLTISAILIGAGWCLFMLFERTNPDTFGGMTFPDAAFAALFESIMPRSGGFSIVNQADLRGVSKLTVIIFMFIGGSAGSTAGGIKNVTAGILFISAVNYLRGRNKVTVYGRTVPQQQITAAVSMLVIVLSVCFAGSAAISLIQPELPLTGVLFESMSAIAICGLSHGITPAFAPASMVIIMLFMFFGRIGILTIGMATFMKRYVTEKVKYPDEWILIG